MQALSSAAAASGHGSDPDVRVVGGDSGVLVKAYLGRSSH